MKEVETGKKFYEKLYVDFIILIVEKFTIRREFHNFTLIALELYSRNYETV